MCEQGALAARADVAGQQQSPPPACQRNFEHQRALVDGRGDATRRPQRAQQQIAHLLRGRAQAALGYLRAVGAGGGAQFGQGGIAAPARRQPQRRGGNAAQHTGQPAAVVQISVAQHRQIQAADAQRAQRGQHAECAVIRPVRPGRARIYQHGGAAALHQHGVAVPHI